MDETTSTQESPTLIDIHTNWKCKDKLRSTNINLVKVTRLTFAASKVFDAGFFLSQAHRVVVFTFVFMCDVFVVTQW